jgi:Viral coat protein P2 N-terminal domain
MPNLFAAKQFISGISGVVPGGTATVNMPTNLRIHKLILNTQGQTAYTAPMIVPGPTWNGGAFNAIIKGVVSAGNIASWVIEAAGSGMVNGTYGLGQVMIVDSTGMFTIVPTIIVTVAGGAVTAVTGAVTAGIGPVNPATLITALRLKVNGVIIRDIAPSNMIAIAIANGYKPQFGELPIFFTEPWRKILRENTITSWDLIGQQSFTIEMQISNAVTAPSVTGIYSYDYTRNMRKVKSAAQAAATGVAIGGMAPFNLAVAQHQTSVVIPAGRFDVTTLPWQQPTNRLWLFGSNPGNIYQAELSYDSGNVAYQATAAQNYSDLSEEGFQIGNPSTAPLFNGGGIGPVTANGQAFISDLLAQTVPNGPLISPSLLGGAPNQLTGYANFFPFDFAFIFDFDQRIWNALRCTTGFFVRVFSNVSQTLTIVQETTPGKYSG